MKRLLIILLINSMAFGQAWIGIISPSRAIDWAVAGIPGGIPSLTWSQSGATISATGSNQTAEINAALAACGTNHYVLLAPGTFRVNGNLSASSDCELRGAGANLTILDGHGTSGNFVNMGSGSPSISVATNITSGATSGSTAFVVASAANMAIGKLMIVNELNDSSFVTIAGDGTDNCTFCDGGIGWNGTRVRGQIVEITNVAGTTITFSPPLYSAYTLTPQATPFTALAKHAGIANLQLLNNNTGYGISISMSMCEYCWIRGVEGNYADGDHVQVYWGLHDEIRDSYFSNAYLHTPGTRDSDLGLLEFTSASLVENNILERLHISILLEHGSAGNVIAYNYSHGNFDAGATNALLSSLDLHGAHPQFNLFEGNVDNSIYPDSVWGSSSHNTVFRSWAIGTSKICNPLTGRGAVICSLGNGHFAYQASRAIQVSTSNTSWNFVGNVLGSIQQTLLKLNGTGGPIPQVPSILWNTSRVYDTQAYGWSFGYSNLSDGGTVGTGCSSPCKDSTTPAVTALQHGNYTNPDGLIVWSGGLTHTLPASFFLPAKPSWWITGIPYPAIGPDVTTGSGPGGHVFSTVGGNPAQACFSAIMGGIDGGEGSPYVFNADSCYAQAAFKACP